MLYPVQAMMYVCTLSVQGSTTGLDSIRRIIRYLDELQKDMNYLSHYNYNHTRSIGPRIQSVIAISLYTELL